MSYLHGPQAIGMVDGDDVGHIMIATFEHFENEAVVGIHANPTTPEAVCGAPIQGMHLAYQPFVGFVTMAGWCDGCSEWIRTHYVDGSERS